MDSWLRENVHPFQGNNLGFVVPQVETAEVVVESPLGAPLPPFRPVQPAPQPSGGVVSANAQVQIRVGVPSQPRSAVVRPQPIRIDGAVRISAPGSHVEAGANPSAFRPPTTVPLHTHAFPPISETGTSATSFAPESIVRLNVLGQNGGGNGKVPRFLSELAIKGCKVPQFKGVAEHFP